MARQSTFEIYRDRKQEWRWRLRAPNGEIVADSAEGYDRETGAIASIVRHKTAVWTAAVTVIKPKKAAAKK